MFTVTLAPSEIKNASKFSLTCNHENKLFGKYVCVNVCVYTYTHTHQNVHMYICFDNFLQQIFSLWHSLLFTVRSLTNLNSRGQGLIATAHLPTVNSQVFLFTLSLGLTQEPKFPV